VSVLNGILNFIVTDIFGQGAIFLALIALIGLVLQKKPFSEIVRGTILTAIGFFVLTTGTGIVSDQTVSGLSRAFAALFPATVPANEIGAATIMEDYAQPIGIVMIVAFLINIIFARFSKKWKSIFLTGHMLYWFPFIFIAAGVNAGLRGFPLIALATVFTALYMIVSPNVMRPLVKEVTGGDESFTIGHPTTILSVIAGYLGKVVGNKEKSTEDIKFPKGLGFLREVYITGSILIGLTYIVIIAVLSARGLNPAEVIGYDTTTFTFIFQRVLYFGAGVSILLTGVRMLISEIVPAFKGFAEKIVPGAIPALDCPVLFPYAPNALFIGFLCCLVTSTITVLLTVNVFPAAIVPLIFACFFEGGTAAIVANATGGVRGCIIGSIVNGAIIILLVGFGTYFYDKTINDWMLVFGGQDFSFWGIIEGTVAKLLVGLGL